MPPPLDEDGAVFECPPSSGRGSILFVHGSSAFNADGVVPIEGLDSPYARDPFYRDLAVAFEAAGWCVLRYSKPGVSADHVDMEIYSTTDLEVLEAQLRQLWDRLPDDRPRVVFAWSEGSLHVRALPLGEIDAVILLGAISTNIADAIAAQGGPGREELLRTFAGRDRREMLGADRPVGRLLDELALEDNWRVFAPRPDLPILVLHGDADREVPVAQASVWRERLPGHRRLTVATRSDRDHRLMRSGTYEPAALVQEIMPWLEQAVPAPTTAASEELPRGSVATASAEVESPECRSERAAILDAMARSREHPCASNAECVTVTNPGSPVGEFDQVVHATDHDELERRSLEHLERCGTFHVYEPIDAVRVVEARCRDGRCQEEETILHIDE
jgi:pimeloyl-ACP methyl ester carboxylesterase